MKFALLVTAAPYQSAAPQTALAFAESALDGGHQVIRVFFHADGVHNGNRLAAPPAGELNIVQAWSRLAAERRVDLVLCSTAGLRRGVREATRAAGFRISGLGQMIEAGQSADRVITFGA